MERQELIQNMLVNSTERLINAAAEVQNNIKWLLNIKGSLILKKTKDKEYKAGDLLAGKESWSYKYINKEAMMKLVFLYSSIDNYYLGHLTTTERHRNIINLNMFFMQDPDKILKSKAKLTEAEKIILREMKEYYDASYLDVNRIYTLDSRLVALKHRYSLVYNPSWGFTLDDLLKPNFLDMKLTCGSVII